MATEAYVWQQARTPAVDDAVCRGADVFDGYLLHAADVSFRGSTPQLTRFDGAWDVVAKTGKPAGFVIRISLAEGGLGSSPRHAEAIADIIHSICETSRAAGVNPKEAQIDYDCPESKLGSYAAFFRALRTACPDIPVVFTALPTWLDLPSFSQLARASSGYVLQVHSLKLPGPQDSRITLCNVGDARAAIQKAGEAGKPFRVALPTYQCVVLVDGDGKRVEVVSEGGVPGLAAGLRAIPGTSDPLALANLVAELRTYHPRLLSGIIWYRLPVDTDRMNWSWTTFQPVADGRTPVSRLETALIPDPSGSVVLEIRNIGERPEPLPKRLVVTWTGGNFEAADGLNGYSAASPQPSESLCRFQLENAPLFDLPPGKTVVAGWVRVRSASTIQISIDSR